MIRSCYCCLQMKGINASFLNTLSFGAFELFHFIRLQNELNHQTLHTIRVGTMASGSEDMESVRAGELMEAQVTEKLPKTDLKNLPEETDKKNDNKIEGDFTEDEGVEMTSENKNLNDGIEETDEQSALVSENVKDGNEGNIDQLSLEDDLIPAESTAQESAAEDDQDGDAESNGHTDLVKDDSEDAEGQEVEQTDPGPDLNVPDDTEDGLQEPNKNEEMDEVEEPQGNTEENLNKNTSEDKEEKGNNTDDLLSDTAAKNDMHMVEEGTRDNIEEANSNEEKENVSLTDQNSEEVSDSHIASKDAFDNGMEISDLTKEENSNIEIMETAESEDNINTDVDVDMEENEDTIVSVSEIVDETSNTPDGNEDKIISVNEIVDETSNTPDENEDAKDSAQEVVDETLNALEENDNTKDSIQEVFHETSNTPERNDETKDSTKDKIGEASSLCEANIPSEDELSDNVKETDKDNQNEELNKKVLNSKEKKKDDEEDEDSNAMTDILINAGYEIDTNSKHEAHHESSVDSDRDKNTQNANNELVNSNHDDVSEGIHIRDFEEMDSNDAKDPGSIENVKVETSQETDNGVINNNLDGSSQGSLTEMGKLNSNEVKAGLNPENAIDVKSDTRIEEDIEISIDNGQSKPVEKTSGSALLDDSLRSDLSLGNTKTGISNTEQAMDVDEPESTSNKAETEVDEENESAMEVLEEPSENKGAVEKATGETSDTAATEKSNESSGVDGSFGLMEEGIKREGKEDDVSELKIVGVTSAVSKNVTKTDLSNDFGLKIDSVSGADDPETRKSETGQSKAALIKQEKQVDKTENSKETKNGSKVDNDVIAVKEEKKPPPPKPKASKIQKCIVCSKVGKCKYNIVRNGDVKHLCDDLCFKQFRGNPTAFLKQAENEKSKQSEPPAKNGTQTPASHPASAKLKSLINTAQLQKTAAGEPYKTCTVCQLMNVRTSKPFLNWQGLDYCGEECLGKFQGNLSTTCNYCSSQINQSNKAKFCARIGEEVKHFCSQTCNTEFVKRIKACAFCNKDLAQEKDSFMAPVGNEGMFKDFCSQSCLLKYEDKNGKDLDISGELVRGCKTAVVPSGNFSCSVCSKMGPVKHELKLENKLHRLCSDPCFSAFQYANKLTLNSCDNCGTSCFNETGAHFVQFEGKQKRFCSFMCVNAFRNQKKKLTPCAWCGAKKSNFDMIERVDSSNKFQLFCSLNCLSLYRVNLQATSNQAVLCDQCRKFVPAQYHLTMSDASVRNFCSYGCVMSFQSQFTNPPNPKQTASLGNQKQVVTLGNQKQSTPPNPVNQQVTTTRSGRVVTRGPKQQQYVTQQPQTRKETTIKPNKVNQESFPIISNVVSLAPQGSQQQINIKSPANVTVLDQQSGKTITTSNSGNQTVQQQIIIQPPPPKVVKNKSMLCKPFVQTKATSCRPHTQNKEVQTEGKPEPEKIYIPVPVPIYCPTPLSMYSVPTPVLIPVPVPIPIPVFIPTTKKSAASILKHIKEIQEKIPADPLEAELLMMAEAVAGKGGDSSSDSDEGETEVPPTKETTPANNSGGVLGEDMLQMALRMASEMSDEPVMDLENSLEPVAVNTEPPAPPSVTPVVKDPEPDEDDEYVPTTRSKRGRGGSAKRQTKSTPRRNPKRQRTELTPQPQLEEPSSPSPPAPQAPPPDANFHLKYTYGVNAFKHWVTQKNGQIDQTPKTDVKRQTKTFKTDILQCTADELNYALCLFVKEVRKPNGEEYAVDSIFYLCLGIQQYLFENGRIDNVFTDMYYERFTECLNELLCRYEPKLNHAGQLVCRIEEEHLWESKQLGAHSPHVLLNTLVYFNTKYFMLKTSEDHLKLSFTHIMKHWKKTASGRGSGVGPNAGRSVYLRYYCPTPQNKENATKKKKEEMPVYEQTENLDNPLRCPVKLYEFYLSKCPESIKNRNDTFYLVPERSCVPDSPVWYSTAMLGVDAMAKMLNRIRLVREIQEAHLHTQPIYI